MNSQSLTGSKGTHTLLPLQPTPARNGPTPLGNARIQKRYKKETRGDLGTPVPQASNSSLAWPTATESQRDHLDSRASQTIADIADELLESLRKSRESALAIRHHKPLMESPQRGAQQELEQSSDCSHLQQPVASAMSGLLSHEGITSHAVPIRRKRSPWNKGLTIPESTKLKISLAQKQRWRTSPHLRASVCAKLKGRVAWNKGKKLSLETRQKMSLAKQGRHIPRSVRRQISKSHQGLTHTPETAKVISEQLSGVPKSLEHREAISAAQRRRLTVAGILSAVESVHSAEEASTSYVPRSAARGLGGSSGRLMDSVVLTTYKSELREFRALQEELEPWTAAFKDKHARKPSLADVESTRIPWLINKYKQYILMRERLLTDTQSLRTKLEKAIPDPSMRGREQESRAAPEGLNSNAIPTSSGSDVGARMRQALEYKRSRAASSANGLAASPSRLAPAAPTEASANAPAGASAASVATAQSGRFADRRSSGSGIAGQASGFNGRLANLPPNAPLRVRNAMSAAMQYRQEKVEKAAAAVREAAAQAASKSAAQAAKSASLAANGATPQLTSVTDLWASDMHYPEESSCHAGSAVNSRPLPSEGIVANSRGKAVAGAGAQQDISGEEFVAIPTPSPA